MKVKTITALVLASLATSVAHAATFSVANNDVTLAGGVTAGAVYADNTGSKERGNFVVSDALLDISVAPTKGVGATLGVGALGMNTIVATGTPTVKGDLDVQYGWVTVKPTSSITVDAGKIATKIGYESATTYSNGNMLLGGTWNAQPIYYPGARATFAIDANSNLFVEANEEKGIANGGLGYVVGGNTSFGGVNLSAAYSDAKDARDIFDLILSGSIGGVPVAANFDYHDADNMSKNDSAYALALYAAPKFGTVSLPVRFEYLDDGKSGLLGGVDQAYTFTVTPTYNFTDSTFVRAELATVQADNDVFTSKSGKAQDSRTSVAVQAGLRF